MRARTWQGCSDAVKPCDRSLGVSLCKFYISVHKEILLVVKLYSHSWALCTLKGVLTCLLAAEDSTELVCFICLIQYHSVLFQITHFSIFCSILFSNGTWQQFFRGLSCVIDKQRESETLGIDGSEHFQHPDVPT